MPIEKALLDPVLAPPPAQAPRVASPALAPGLAAPGLTLAVETALAPLEREWRAFEETAVCTVFQTFDWLDAYQRHIGARSAVQPAIVTGRDAAGALQFILPLAVERAQSMKRLVFLGWSRCDYNAGLFAPDYLARLPADGFAAVWREITAALQAHALAFDLVDLRKMPARLGEAANPMLALPTRQHPSDAHLAHLASSWEAYYGRKSAAARHRDRGKRKRIAKLGEVRLAPATEPAARIDTLALLMAQKGEAFARMGVANFFLEDGCRDFFFDLATGPSAARMHISTLDVGALRAAANFGVRFRGTFHHILASYDGSGEIAKCGPGTIHLQELLRSAIESGDTIFDFTVGDERYKFEWADTVLTLHDHLAARTVKGRGMTAALRAFLFAKRAIKQNPRLWKAFTALRARRGGAKAAEAPEKIQAQD